MPNTRDHRVYRHPGSGEEAHLFAGPITRPYGPWWEFRLVPADGRIGTVAGQMGINWWRSHAAARKGYREHLQALQKEGWVRVDKREGDLAQVR
jgi:hypothetical protein